jgi:hypothetical protein
VSVRVLATKVSSIAGSVATYYNAVVPGKDGKLVQASDEIPASGDVAGEEDTKSEDGYRVHLAAMLMSHGARNMLRVVCPDRGHWGWGCGVGTVMVFAMRGIGLDWIGDWRLSLEADRGRRQGDSKCDARLLCSVNIKITY